MRRRCTFTAGSDVEHGWLIQITINEKAAFYFFETKEGKIEWVYSDRADVTLLPEDTPFPQKKKKVKEKADAE